MKKNKLEVFHATVSDKLSRIYFITDTLSQEIKEIYDSPDFFITVGLPFLSIEFEEYREDIDSIKTICKGISRKIEDEIKQCNAQIGQANSQ